MEEDGATQNGGISKGTPTSPFGTFAQLDSLLSSSPALFPLRPSSHYAAVTL